MPGPCYSTIATVPTPECDVVFPGLSNTHLWILITGLASLVVALVTAMLKMSVGASAAEAALSAGALSRLLSASASASLAHRGARPDGRPPACPVGRVTGLRGGWPAADITERSGAFRFKVSERAAIWKDAARQAVVAAERIRWCCAGRDPATVAVQGHRGPAARPDREDGRRRACWLPSSVNLGLPTSSDKARRVRAFCRVRSCLPRCGLWCWRWGWGGCCAGWGSRGWCSRGRAWPGMRRARRWRCRGSRGLRGVLAGIGAQDAAGVLDEPSLERDRRGEEQGVEGGAVEALSGIRAGGNGQQRRGAGFWLEAGEGCREPWCPSRRAARPGRGRGPGGLRRAGRGGRSTG
jgi:hypothetical protein